MTKLRERIKERRLALNLTLLEVAERIGVKEATMQRYESGEIKNIKHETIVKLAEVFSCTPQYLMGWSDSVSEPKPKPLPDNIIPLKKIRFVPLVGKIACGTPILAEQNYEETILLPQNVNADFALRCQGDSMIDANVFDGDIVFIKEAPVVENGEIAAVVIGEEATLKKVYYQGDTITLLPANTSYEPMVFKKEEINDIRICGKAVAVLRHL